MNDKVIPNELKIMMNTNIPGYQNIQYKPSMTFPNDKVDESIQFNPLVKLKTSVIKSMPESIRVKEFFSKGLFDSLNRTLSNPNKITLSEATENGNVDNNIQITLDTILPENGVLYLNKNPYVIIGVQWTKGDWKINKKIQQVPQLELRRITDPNLYSSIVKEEIISGEKELETLPTNVVYGPNYTGPSNDVGKGVGLTPPVTAPAPAPSTSQIVRPERPLSAPSSSQLAPYPALPPSAPVIPPKPVKGSPLLIENKPSISSTTPLPAKPPKILPIEYGELTPMVLPTLTPSKTSTNQLKTYFQKKDYYFMINTMFQNMKDNEKKFVINILKETTSIDAKYNVSNISVKAYNESLNNGLRVISNSGGGDCFFIAVADAINYYNANCKTMDERIIYNNYGNKIKFTQMSLREIVSKKLQETSRQDFETLKEYGELNVDYLNQLYIDNYKSHIESLRDKGLAIQTKEFLDIIHTLYLGHDNFLVQKPTILNNNTINTPFSLMDKSKFTEYIKSSSYWADKFAIDTMCEVLGLNIITILNNKSYMSIPYVSNSGRWSRYLFLYSKDNHFELVTFNYTFRKKVYEPKFGVKKIASKKIIFNKYDKIFPPFYILFLYFASYYINIRDINQRKNADIFPNQIMENLYNIFSHIISVKDRENEEFIKVVNTYFHPSIFKKGGADYPNQVPYYNPYPGRYPYQSQRPYPYSYPMPYPYPRPYPNPYASSYFKYQPPSETSKTNLSYYITIDVFLQKGDKLTPDELSKAKCKLRWNDVRKSFANMTGREYKMLPDYSNLPSSKTINTRKINSHYNNIVNKTRKNYR